MGRGKSAADGGPVIFSIIDDHPDLCYGVLGRLPQTSSSFAAGVMAATVEEFLALDAAAAPAKLADGAHQATLERAFGRIFAVFMALMMVVFWSSSATLAGNRPGGMAADVLLSALLAGQALRALRQPPSQRDLWLMIVMALAGKSATFPRKRLVQNFTSRSNRTTR